MKKQIIVSFLWFLGVGLSSESFARSQDGVTAPEVVVVPSEPSSPQKKGPSLKAAAQTVLVTIPKKAEEEDENPTPSLAERKKKAIDDFLKDEGKVKNLLEKLTDAIGQKITQTTMTQEMVNKNLQAAIDKLQQANSYYYSGFISADMHDKMEKWIEDLLEKIDNALKVKPQPIKDSSKS